MTQQIDVERLAREAGLDLDALSDKVRKGEPIGFMEAIAVIEYQQRIQMERKEKSIFGRISRAYARIRALAEGVR